MAEPVDLTNLRSMIDDDVDTEKELFKEFIRAFETGINVLRSNIHDAAAEIWRGEAHALKGISFNLGAAKLGALCATAQDSHTEHENSKKELLENITAEYEQVKSYLKQLHNNL